MSGDVKVMPMADGAVQVTVVHPARPNPAKSGVILYMDAFGPRPALVTMAMRIAGWGHVVLVPDLFYRLGPYGPIEAGTGFEVASTRAELMRLMGGTTQDMTIRDTGAFLHLLAAEGAVGPTGTVGYCFGGGRALNAAAAYPDRIAAAASFHGGNLASDQPDSPHMRVRSIKGRVYIGCAGVDRSFPPDQSAKLAQALRMAEVDHVIENYVRMEHGWCVPDHSVYDANGADRHWLRLERFFSEGLAGI